MKHIEADRLWDYITGDLDAEQTKIIRAHLEVCPKCKQDYDMQMEFHNELLEVNDDMPSPGFSDNVVAKIEKHLRVEKANRFWLKFTKVAVINAIIIAVGLPLLMLALQKIEFSISQEYVNKVMWPLLTVCLMLWLFYIMDRVLKRRYWG